MELKTPTMLPRSRFPDEIAAVRATLRLSVYSRASSDNPAERRCLQNMARSARRTRAEIAPVAPDRSHSAFPPVLTSVRRCARDDPDSFARSVPERAYQRDRTKYL